MPPLAVTIIRSALATTLLVLIAVHLSNRLSAADPATFASIAGDPTLIDWKKLTDADWKKRLTADQYRILRTSGTEAPFCEYYEAAKKNGAGEYRCAGCDLPLYRSEDIFTSGTGWPSFRAPLPGAMKNIKDVSHGMVRIEVRCARCDGHLGHLFDDGPAPEGMRYCINGAALRFVSDTPSANEGVAVFAGGCFWGTQNELAKQPGVTSTRVGYIGGKNRHPSYEDICTGASGHAEGIEIRFDPKVTTYGKLLAAFMEIHDPTQVDGQGVDIGTQYRSAVFPIDETQRAAAAALIAAIDGSGRLKRKVATTIEAKAPFWPAEDYHQQYLVKHPNRPSCHHNRGIVFSDLVK